MEKWHELTESELESTRGNSNRIVDLLEKKVGMRIEDASERFAEIASRYHLYDEPEETTPTPDKEKEERIMELSPKDPDTRPDITPKH
ncbi:transcriptional regulator [Bdellovibrio sp. GT3]